MKAFFLKGFTLSSEANSGGIEKIPSPLLRYLPHLVVTGAFLIGLYLRLVHAADGLLQPDELRKLNGALGYLDGRMYADIDHPSMEKHLIALSITLFGASELTVRLPNIILSSATILLVFGIGQRISSPWAGVIGAWFLALTPIHIGYSYYAKEDAALSFFLALTIFIYLRDSDLDVTRRLNRTWFLCGLCFATKFSAGMFPAIFLIHAHLTGLRPGLLRRWRVLRKELVRLVGWSFLGFVLFSPWHIIHLPTFIYGGLGHWLDEQVDGHQRHLMGETYSQTPWWYFGPYLFLLIPTIIVILFIIGIFLNLDPNFRQQALIPMNWLFIPLAVHSLFTFSSKSYGILFVPPLTLIAGMATWWILIRLRTAPWIKAGIPILLTTFILTSSIAAQPHSRMYHNGLFSNEEFEPFYGDHPEWIARSACVERVQVFVENGDVVSSDLDGLTSDYYLGTDYVRWESTDVWIFTFYGEKERAPEWPDSVAEAEVANISWVLVTSGIQNDGFRDFIHLDNRSTYAFGYDLYGVEAPMQDAECWVYSIDWS